MEKTFFDKPVKDKKVINENLRKIATGQVDDYCNWLFVRLFIL